MKVYLFALITVCFFIIFAPKASASSLYYAQESSNGELYMGSSAPLTDHNTIDYWTPDRVNYTPLYQTIEPFLYNDGTDGGAAHSDIMGTTTDDEYIDHINFLDEPSRRRTNL